MDASPIQVNDNQAVKAGQVLDPADPRISGALTMPIGALAPRRGQARSAGVDVPQPPKIPPAAPPAPRHNSPAHQPTIAPQTNLRKSQTAGSGLCPSELERAAPTLTRAADLAR